MNQTPPSALLVQQLEYYRARAAEYDQWWLREGRYDRGPELKARWFAEVKEVSEALVDFRPAGRVLELACGTGNWSGLLLPWASHFTALDGSSEMLAIHRAKSGSARIRYVETDVFEWVPDGKYEVIFFGFWLSHVPPERFETFWEIIRSCLAPSGRVFLVDSRHEPTSTALDHQLPEPPATVLTRRLNDGREFQIYKIFHEPLALTARLQALGWTFEVRQTGNYFLYGRGQRTYKEG